MYPFPLSIVGAEHFFLVQWQALPVECRAIHRPHMVEGELLRVIPSSS
jgi:hypothetical protein